MVLHSGTKLHSHLLPSQNRWHIYSGHTRRYRRAVFKSNPANGPALGHSVGQHSTLHLRKATAASRQSMSARTRLFRVTVFLALCCKHPALLLR
jgi:hypothetical protein